MTGIIQIVLPVSRDEGAQSMVPTLLPLLGLLMLQCPLWNVTETSILLVRPW